MEQELETTLETIEETEQKTENAPEEVQTETKAGKAVKAPKKDEKPSPYEIAILAEMRRRADDGDELLNDALANPGKNIHDCFSYVKSQARKKAVAGCAMIEDNIVYGWAHHYYIESKATIDKEMKAETAKKAVEKPQPPKNVLDITQAIMSSTKAENTGKREKKKDSLDAGFVPMQRYASIKEAKKGSKEQAKSVEQMDMFADFFATEE